MLEAAAVAFYLDPLNHPAGHHLLRGEEGVGQDQGGKDPVVLLLGEVLAGRLLEDQAEEDEAGVRVVDALARREVGGVPGAVGIGAQLPRRPAPRPVGPSPNQASCQYGLSSSK